MGEIMMLFESQGNVERERGTRTILEFLAERMDGGGVQVGTRRTLKQRLGFIGIGCCGATWINRRPTIGIRNQEDDEDVSPEVVDFRRSPLPETSDNNCEGENPARSGINLAAALAAEREYRAAQEEPNDVVNPVGMGTPLRVSLMRLLEEPEEGRVKMEGGGGEREVVVGSDRVCCVCMVREKGAAFIPCGHTFCRVCSRELWVNRGSCPLCNRLILEILDIF